MSLKALIWTGVALSLLFICGLSVQGGGLLAFLAFLAFGGCCVWYFVAEDKKKKLRQALTQPQAPATAATDTPSVQTIAVEPVEQPQIEQPAISEPVAQPQEKAVVPVQQQAVAVVPVGGAALIGREVETGNEVSISQAARLQGLYIIGVKGTGKSTFIANLIAEDMKHGLGLCLLDPHGDLTKDVLARVPDNREEDVILLDLMDSSYPFGLNVFECPDPSNLEQVALTASFVMHIFEKVWDVGTSTPQLAQVLRNVTFTLIQNPGTTLAELPLLLQDDNVRNKLVGNVANTQVKLFWTTYNRLRPGEQLERSSSTLNKADAFLTQPIIANIVGQSHTTIDFRKIMDEGKIVLVQLTPQLEDLSRLVGAVFIGQLLMAAMSRKDISAGERKQFNLYADEYQRFATEDFATLLSEARKFGVATTIAHQYLDQLDEKNRGASVNAANLVAFRVSGQDAALLAREFDATPEESLEVRVEPVRVPARDVVWQLMRKGHRDKDVTDFVNRWLAPAQETWDNRENVIQIKQKESWIALDEFLKRSDFPDAMNTLNELLFECQSQERYNFNLPPRMTHALMLINGLSEGIEKLVKFKPSGSSTVYVLGLSQQPPSLFTSSPEFDTLCKWDVTREQINLIKNHVCNKNAKKEEKYDLCVNFILHLFAVMRVLADDPILVDTGQYREVRDKSRPYADVQNEFSSAD